jgi:hypothetical protein
MLFSPDFSQAQTYSQLVEYGDKKMVQRDYYYAIDFYRQAMSLDSNSVEINWKYAEALRKYKDYPKAEFYYAKVFKKEDAKIYSRSVFWLASMQYQNGKYDQSLSTWKKAKKVYKRDRDSYEYIKSAQMIKNALWARRAVRDTTDHTVAPLPAPVNTKNTEFGPVIFNDKLYFSSLQADSINFQEEVFDSEYSVEIYTADREDSIFNNVAILEDVVTKGFNTANGSFSPDGKRFYFSRCNSNYECKIFVGKVDGDRIFDIDSLGDVINEPGYISTMPHCAQVGEYEVLFFASNIKHNYGGLDIWYSVIKDGNQYMLPKSLGPDINTMDDEITPFYDTIENKLYFSSSWHAGFGGQDIFWAKNFNFTFKDPVNAGLPINSTKNDMYYMIDQKDGTSYLSSNREGVLFAKNPTCCNDIFSAKLPEIEVPPSRFKDLNDLNKKLPVKLYFHNDEPNPRTRDTTSTLTYMESYDQYVRLKPKYRREYSSGLTGDNSEEAKEDIDDFFVQYVEQGVIDLKDFLHLLKIELDKGYEIEVTIKGFASPLAKTDYNVPLTKRRINSLIKYLRVYDYGSLKPYLDGTAPNGGHLTFVKIPFGEYTADQLISDNPNDAKNSVYSRKAGLERKIEIQSVSFVEKDSSYAKMKFDKQAHDFGSSKAGDVLTYEFNFTNTGQEVLEIGELVESSDNLVFEVSKSVFQPGESGSILLTWYTEGLSGITFARLIVNSNIKEGKKELTLTSEIH